MSQAALLTKSLLNPHIYSLTDWLVLAGVSIETGNAVNVHRIEIDDILSPALQASEPAPAALKVDMKTPAASKAKPSLQISKFNTLNELNDFCTSWKAIGLTKTASRAVLGTGQIQSPALMVVTEMPDDTEDRHATAWSGPHSQMIRQALALAGIDPEAVYFTYLSKWRTPAKRALTTSERDLCAQILAQEVALVSPGTILALGDASIKALIPDIGVNNSTKPQDNTYDNQYLNRKLPFFASQKPELLVKNPLMKKSLWLGLLDLAAAIRTKA